MLQGACCSRPVYGHSHYKKFWLKKMESEDEQQSRLTPEPEYFRVSSERSGAFWRSRASTGGICSSLELKGSGTSRIRLSPVRSTEDKPRGASKQNLTTSEGTELECALALGLQMSHRDSSPPLKRSAFRGEMGGEEQKPWEAIRQSRHKLFHSQSGRSRAGGDRDPFPVKKECRDPGEVFGREEPGEEIGSDPQQQLEGSSNLTRMCAHCKTVNTPLWRNGPNGPKTLCNACGIRYKKIGRRGEQQSSLLIKRKQEADLHHPPRKKSSASVGKSFATDAEEGAALLMGLSSGLVDALA